MTEGMRRMTTTTISKSVADGEYLYPHDDDDNVFAIAMTEALREKFDIPVTRFDLFHWLTDTH